MRKLPFFIVSIIAAVMFLGYYGILILAVNVILLIVWVFVEPHYNEWMKKRAAKKHKREFDEVLKRARERNKSANIRCNNA